MAKVTDVFPVRSSVYQEERARLSLLPERILQVRGKVTGAEQLLLDSPEQAYLEGGDFGAFCYEKFRHSLCHGWSSGPVPFILRHIMGITIAEPGCRTLRIIPHLGSLKQASATYPTPLGVVSVRHTAQENGKILTEYDAPEGIKVIVD